MNVKRIKTMKCLACGKILPFDYGLMGDHKSAHKIDEWEGWMCADDE